jgi:hypothetical protein
LQNYSTFDSQLSVTDANAAPQGGDPLQFDTAGAPGEAMTCANCGRTITNTYYDLDGSHICPVCRGKLLAKKPATGGSAFLHAFVYGAAACFGGAVIYFAVAAIFNLELALVAILIGYMVGAAVRKGASGSGGRKYQLMAGALVYLSVGLAYTAFVIKLANDAAAKTTASSSARPAASVADSDAAADSTADSTDADDDTAADKEAASDEIGARTPGGHLASNPSIFARALGLLIMVLTIPVVFIIGTLPSGIISALIIGFGMRQAWRMTDGEEVAAATITGPYRIAPAAPPAT